MKSNNTGAILKEPKIIFFDPGAVTGNAGAKLENLVAVCLRKWLHYLEDTKGKDVQLSYIRDKEKREVDFLVKIDRKIEFLIEVKTSDDDLARPLLYFHNKLNPKKSIQLVQNLKHEKTVKGIAITSAVDWLARLEI